MADPARRWAQALAAWAVPAHILERVPESPWRLDTDHFRVRAEMAANRHTPADARALEALAGGGTVLDVGCGAGAASRPLVPPATAVTGVDSSADMLRAFRAVMAGSGAAVDTVEGAWNVVAPQVDVADVAVCHDVLYNEPDLLPFVVALSGHARRRVVVVIPTVHPQSWTAPYWLDLHRLERPTGPVVDDAVAVIASSGVAVRTQRYTEPTLWAGTGEEHLMSSLRRRLCLTDADEAALRAAVRRHGAPREREAVAVWWDTTS